jgi:hypothetical protein
LDVKGVAQAGGASSSICFASREFNYLPGEQKGDFSQEQDQKTDCPFFGLELGTVGSANRK